MKYVQTNKWSSSILCYIVIRTVNAFSACLLEHTGVTNRRISRRFSCGDFPVFIFLINLQWFVHVPPPHPLQNIFYFLLQNSMNENYSFISISKTAKKKYILRCFKCIFNYLYLRKQRVVKNPNLTLQCISSNFLSLLLIHAH